MLCVNKDKPKMHCNGKCHLKKEIKETEKNSDNPNSPVPVPKTNQEKYPVLIKLRNNLLISFYNLKTEMVYLTPYNSNPFIEIPTPPPEKLFCI